MKIIIEPHTLIRAEERGVSENEIIEVLNNGTDESGKKGRLRKSCVFDFNSAWLGKHYEQKKIDDIFVIEHEEIITVTVYVFYGKWK